MATPQDKSPVERRADGTVAKGTPNPGGQPKWVKEVRAALRECAPIGAAKLRDILENPEAKDADKIRAADVVFKYTVPPPKQTHRIEQAGLDPLKELSAEMIVAFVKGKKQEGT